MIVHDLRLRFLQFAFSGAAESFIPHYDAARGNVRLCQLVMAPEQAEDASRVDGRADIYSLGCTLYYLLTGRPPYSGKSMMDKLLAHKTKAIPSFQEVRPDVPEEIDLLFQKMIAKDPAKRYPSMDKILADLEREDATLAIFSAICVILPILAVLIALIILLVFLFR